MSREAASVDDAPAPSPAVSCLGVRKSFGDIQALSDGDLEVPRGQVVALVGENGAGKSTMMRIIAGELAADSGDVRVDVSVGLVRQQLSTVPELTVLENIALGAAGRGRIDWKALRGTVAELMERTGLSVDLDVLAGRLPVALQQRVELVSVLHRGAECLLLDEPTTYLTPHEVDGLFETVHDLTSRGVSAVFISHKLREVVANCDEVVVLAHGATVARFDRPPFDLRMIGRAMTSTNERVPASTPGRRVGGLPPSSDDPVRLNAGSGALQLPVGGILGIAGVAGNGQDDLVESLSGVRRHARWSPIVIDDVDTTSERNNRRRKRGVRVIPGNVKEAGVAPSASLTDNFLTARPSPAYRQRGWIRRRKAGSATRELIDTYGVVASGPQQAAGELSGGNLQRFVVARELDGDARLLIAHEPTRGVDFSAAAAIRQRIQDHADLGGAVVLITSDLDELLELSDRVQVLFRGNLGRVYDAADLDLPTLGELLGGVDESVGAGAAS